MMEPAFWAEAPPVYGTVVVPLLGLLGTPVPTGPGTAVDGGQEAPPGQTTGTTVVAGPLGQLACD
jgi:hypothetical protein